MVGQEIPLITALPCSGGTGNGLLHPAELTDWAEDGVAGALCDGAGEVPDGAGLAEPAGPVLLPAATWRAGEVIPFA
jgi:hypothetical protein